MTVEMDTDRANAAIGSNALAEVMQTAMDTMKPEAAYFGAKDGRRTGFFVFDLADAADIPRIAEPLFQQLGARLDLTPVMDFADVQSGLQRYAAG
ncbi:MAG TPA: hypothetical protein VL551_12100 [Actinospica sp.]|nr:hypothetical protein [Actinospica sp.]